MPVTVQGRMFLRILAAGTPVVFTAAWLVLGWLLPGYSQQADTISALAQLGIRTHPPMTAALAVLGLGLLAGAVLAWRAPRAPAVAGSLVLAGLGTLGVAALPLPGMSGPRWLFDVHPLAATGAFVGLHLAVLCGALSRSLPTGLRIAAVVSLAVALPHLGWFLHDLFTGGGPWDGYTEKTFTTALLAWYVAFALLRPATGARSAPPRRTAVTSP